jgi:ParB/RepB/Spo0J family partition protein
MFETKYIKVETIKVEGEYNSRCEGKGLLSLAEDIRDIGQLQAIGVKPLEKPKRKYKYKIAFGFRRYVAIANILKKDTIEAKVFPTYLSDQECEEINYAENEKRQNLTAYELGKFYSEQMKKYNQTPSELAVRLKTPITKIKLAVTAFNFTPDKYKDKISCFNTGNAIPKGKINPTKVHKVSIIANREKLNKKQTETLFEFARRDDVSSKTIVNLGHYIALGYSLEEAQENALKYRIIRTNVSVNKKQIDKYLKEEGITIKQLMRDLFSGKRRVNFDVAGKANKMCKSLEQYLH